MCLRLSGDAGAADSRTSRRELAARSWTAGRGDAGGLALARPQPPTTALSAQGSLGSRPIYFGVVEAYDIEGGSWPAAEPLGTPRGGFAAVTGP